MVKYLIKTDAKVWFAAERTFIHWVGASILLSSSAAILTPYLSSCFSLGALLLTLFAFKRYRNRLGALSDKSTDVPSVFHDVFGPTLIVSAISCLYFLVVFDTYWVE